MARSRGIYIFNTDLPVETMQNIMDDSASRPAPLGQKLLNFIKGCLGGNRNASMQYGVVAAPSGSADAASASLAGTFTGQPTAAQTLVINGVTLTAVAEVADPANNEFRIGTTPTIAAANLAAAINASTTAALSGVVNASSDAGVVTVSCNIPGVIGNSIAVSEGLSNFTWAGAATALASGSGSLPVLKTAHYSR